MTNQAIDQWLARVGVDRACRAFGLSPRTWRHRRQKAAGTLPQRPSRRKPAELHLPVPWRIPDAERDEIRAVLCSDAFCDLAPAQIYATLLDNGMYLCSERTMYRILAEDNLVGERRRGHRRSSYEPPRVQASGPNQAWTWDISYLRGPASRVWFYLYVLIDIYSRKIVGWTIDTVESETVAHRLIGETCKREGINEGQLLLHSDRGAQMTSSTIAELLESLGVTRSLSRPRTSNDNPYSEAAFKTVKYRPDYPERFGDIAQARTWMRKFVVWYNTEHYHSGIGYLHPADVHAGTHHDTINARQAVLDEAYQANPERFRNKPPHALTPPAEAWINKPDIQTKP
ncbi:MAG: IS3 family transposase [Actinomycetia bacterium]|nr:IS3 family transposase [Actinomycetes bacterium]